ncbi:MAG: alpha/beta hydrolase [Thermoprotei archaeon]
MRPTQFYRWLYENQRRMLECNCSGVEQWKAWRIALRRKLIQLLGADLPMASDPPTFEEESDEGTYIRHKITYKIDQHAEAHAYLLYPKKGNGAGVLALHGHGYGKNDLVGLDELGNPKKERYSGYQGSFALKLVERGLIVLVPDQAGFGERREEEDIKRGPSNSSCWQLSTWAMLYGDTAAGVRTHDARRALSVLQEIGAKKMGVIGISGGGTIALYLSAIDERVEATAISGAFSTYRDSILSLQHCIDNYIPGILNYAEQYDVASLIAPRQLFVENGVHDQVFPIEGFRKAVEKVRAVYELLGFPENFVAHEFDGGHEITDAPIDFVEKALKVG